MRACRHSTVSIQFGERLVNLAGMHSFTIALGFTFNRHRGIIEAFNFRQRNASRLAGDPHRAGSVESPSMAVDKPLSTINNPSVPRLERKDTWWIEPLLTAVVFLSFVVYVTWRTFENEFYHAGTLLSPLYSPTIATRWMVFGKHFSPAIFILPVPLLFRTTCYYYRKAYYRAFFWDPPACAIREAAARRNYTGERAFPLILQNIHRYAFYLAAIVMVILWWDAILSFTNLTPSGERTFSIGIGSIIFLANVILLSLYTFSCHSWRHLSGGCVNCFSKSSSSSPVTEFGSG